jgi:hypothetical protein
VGASAGREASCGERRRPINRVVHGGWGRLRGEGRGAIGELVGRDCSVYGVRFDALTIPSLQIPSRRLCLQIPSRRLDLHGAFMGVSRVWGALVDVITEFVVEEIAHVVDGRIEDAQERLACIEGKMGGH